MILKRLIFSFLVVFFSATADAKPPKLTPTATRKKAEEIFKGHVAYKKLTPEILQRTLKNFLNELDPTKTYFLADEVAAWENPSETLLQELLKAYKEEDFSFYEAMYQKMNQAIARRNTLEEQVEAQPLPKRAKVSDFKDLEWAGDLDELTHRLLTLRALQVETAQQLEFESEELFMQRVAKRRKSQEDEILQGGRGKRQKKQMLAYFLKSLSGALDNHTAYFTPQEANQFMIQVQQRLFGIGAQLRDDLTGLTLVRLLEGGPALEGGTLKVNDKIIAVNKEPITGMSFIEAVELIRGPKGTPVELSILREIKEGESKKAEKFDIEVIRDEIIVKEARLEVDRIPYGNGVIAHIRLFSFYQDPNHSSASDIKKALETIKEEEKLEGVLLDLRNNAGGLLPQAVAVSGLFIKKGVVVSIKDSGGNIQHLRNFNDKLSWDGPLLILTNKGSASAAEIVAQALKDYGRALLVGDKHTWGKGTYQTFTLDSRHLDKINPQGEYKVTRGLYYTVSGKSPQLTGTAIDIEVPGGLTELEIGESFAKFPLENDEIPPNFTDSLSDIHPFHRGKMMRMYKNNKQPRVDLYGKHLNTLAQNSEKRIAQNKNYQNFLKEIRKEEFDAETAERYGQNDLQLEESVNILKDLILLEKMHSQANEKLSLAAGE